MNQAVIKLAGAAAGDADAYPTKVAPPVPRASDIPRI
jgi:hypothetical protein